MTEKKKTCFIIMPISTPGPFLDNYRDGAEHFRHVLQCLLVPSVEAADYKAISPIAKGSDLIHAEIIHNLEQSDLVLCDMSCLNPNVFFEFGIRTSLNKPVCVVKDELTKKVPFDTGILDYQEYRGTLEPWELPEEIKKLAEHIKTAAERSKGENMLWKYFGLRTEAKPYAGETGTDAKIDYLTMQMDPLSQQIGMSSERHAIQTEISNLPFDFVVDKLSSYLPNEIQIESIRERNNKFLVEYSGNYNRKDKLVLINKMRTNYGIELHIIEIQSELLE